MRSVVKSGLVLFVAVVAIVWNAGARDGLAPIDLCSKDASTLERIAEEILPENKLDVLNSDDAVVGAVDWDPASGEAGALYLCGANSGYYYLEGNLSKREVTSLHNDEYDSVISVEVEDNDIVLSIHAIYSIGSPDSADYAPFAGVIAIRIP